MAEILLTKGAVSFVDDEDLHLVTGHLWHAKFQDRSGLKYASRWIYGGDGKREVKMHRVIVQPGPGLVVDHIDGDGLNNRRANLRICRHRDNMMNRKINKNTPFGLKGVRQLGKRYQARITLDQKTEYLGCYPTPEEAARAYDLAAVQFFGAFARLNFPSWAGEK